MKSTELIQRSNQLFLELEAAKEQRAAAAKAEMALGAAFERKSREYCQARTIAVLAFLRENMSQIELRFTQHGSRLQFEGKLLSVHELTQTVIVEVGPGEHRPFSFNEVVLPDEGMQSDVEAFF